MRDLFKKGETWFVVSAVFVGTTAGMYANGIMFPTQATVPGGSDAIVATQIAAPASTIESPPAPSSPGKSGTDTGTGGKSGAPATVTVTKDASPIFHTSSGLKYLDGGANMVAPGVRIDNTTAGKHCSTGWLAARDGKNYIVTAGHCGKVGDKFSFTDATGRTYPLGEVVERDYEGTGQWVEGPDIGLIYLYPNSAPWTPQLALDMGAEIRGWIPLSEIDRASQICRLGYRTGLSCGGFISSAANGQFRFDNISDHGDSGGPIFAQIAGAWYAVGINSTGSDTNATSRVASSIAAYMEHFGLQLLS